MAIEVGAKVAGKVSGITNFGAFIDLGDHKTGLVHISEVSDGFVKDIHDVLSIGDEVTVKVLNIGDDGKIALSIRKAQDKPEGHSEHRSEHEHHNNHEHHENNNNYHGGGNGHYRNSNNGGGHSRNNNHSNSNHKESFDDLMSGFLKESEDRLATLKRNTEGKRGGRGGRRS
ncbi:MAG TPA: RNA-binding protein S1 [Lactobacillus sp.]|nr:RNA-binding protein S1 [Lactobacillus sp.]